jgi:membrane protease YdiL (CAAX protease family)
MRRSLELAIFLLLLVPPIVLGWFSSSASFSFATSSVATMVHDIGLTALAMFVVWTSGQPLSAMGVTRRHAGREIGVGAALYIPMLVVLLCVQIVLRALGVESISLPTAMLPRSAGEMVLATLLVLVVAIAEEVVFRGYLLLRLRELTRSTPAAVACSTLLFASGHLYEGVAGVVAVGVLGLVFALVYLWRRSLVAPIVMHFLQDFFGLVVFPQLLR